METTISLGGVVVMPSSPDKHTIGLIADYCGFLREAAYILTMLGEAPADERRDVFDTLVGVEWESSATYVALRRALADRSEDQTSWHADAGRLTTSLHATFAALINSGTHLLGLTADETAPDIRSQCGRIGGAANELDRSWRDSQEPREAVRWVNSVHQDVAALDRSLQSAAVEAPHGDQPSPALTRTPASVS